MQWCAAQSAVDNSSEQMACATLRSHSFLILWVLLNMVVFTLTYHKYLRPQYYYLHSMLGRGLCVSRASAAVINVNTALVLLPVCRGVNSLVYRLLNRSSRFLLALWLSRLTNIHITLALTIVIAAVIHSVTHIINAENFSINFNSQYHVLNWAKYKGQSPLLLVLTTSVGLTGVGMLILLLLMLLMSHKRVRDKHYDLFWATHFLFLPFIVLLVLHPLSGILKEQSNYPLHVSNCQNEALALDTSGGKDLVNNTSACYTEPTFAPMECQGWKWVVIALTVFVVDFALRLCRRNQSSYQVSKVIHLPGEVTQFTLTIEHTLLFKPGQYILLQCPKLSTLEWHPFTVTSVSHTTGRTTITIFIRRRGDWTRSVCMMFSNCGNDRIVYRPNSSLRLLIDGPYCSPMESILKNSIVVCIAAGIGITPFISILNYLYKSENVRWQKPSRLHLIWVVRSADQLTWAANLITELHHKFWCANQPDRFDVAFFVTRNKSKTELRKNFYPLYECLMKERTHLGRPNWAELFTEWSSLYYKKNVSVFICGPQPVYKEVKNTAKNFNGKQCNFRCTHEAFS